MDVLKDRVRWVGDSHSILTIDYSDLKEGQMIEVLDEAAVVIMENNQRISIISIYNDRCFVTPKFMRCVERKTSELKNLFISQAVVGLSPVKKLILKGYNFMFNFDIQNFDTEEDAVKYILSNQ